MTSTRIVTVLLCLLFLSACDSRAKREIIKGCESSGGDSAVCSCAYDKMKDHYPAGWMDHLGENGWYPRDLSQVMVQSALACRAGQ